MPRSLSAQETTPRSRSEERSYDKQVTHTKVPSIRKPFRRRRALVGVPCFVHAREERSPFVHHQFSLFSAKRHRRTEALPRMAAPALSKAAWLSLAPGLQSFCSDGRRSGKLFYAQHISRECVLDWDVKHDASISWKRANQNKIEYDIEKHKDSREKLRWHRGTV